jgi:hypothetical protein
MRKERDQDRVNREGNFLWVNMGPLVNETRLARGLRGAAAHQDYSLEVLSNLIVLYIISPSKYIFHTRL